MQGIYKNKMGGVNGEMDILRKNKKANLEIKNILTEIKNTFDGLICRLDTELEDISMDPTKQKSNEKKYWTQQNIQ